MPSSSWYASSVGVSVSSITQSKYSTTRCQPNQPILATPLNLSLMPSPIQYYPLNASSLVKSIIRLLIWYVFVVVVVVVVVVGVSSIPQYWDRVEYPTTHCQPNKPTVICNNSTCGLRFDSFRWMRHTWYWIIINLKILSIQPHTASQTNY